MSDRRNGRQHSTRFFNNFIRCTVPRSAVMVPYRCAALRFAAGRTALRELKYKNHENNLSVLCKAYRLQEQIEWAVEEKADYIIGETFDAYGEAKLALDAIQKYGAGMLILIC